MNERYFEFMCKKQAVSYWKVLKSIVFLALVSLNIFAVEAQIHNGNPEDSPKSSLRQRVFPVLDPLNMEDTENKGSQKPLKAALSKDSIFSRLSNSANTFVQKTVQKTKSVLQPIIALQDYLPPTPWLAYFSVPFGKNIYDLSQAFLSEIVSDGSFFDYYSQRTALIRNEILFPCMDFMFAFLLSSEMVGLLGGVSYESFINSKGLENLQRLNFVKHIAHQIKENHEIAQKGQEISYWQATLPFYRLTIPLMISGIGLSYLTGYDFFMTSGSLTSLFLAQYPYLQLQDVRREFEKKQAEKSLK